MARKGGIMVKSSKEKVEPYAKDAPRKAAQKQSRPLSDDGKQEKGDNDKEEGAGSGEEQQEEDEVLLHGFSSESDSSDEDDENDGVDPNPIDVGKLPTVAKDDASVRRKLEKAKKQPTDERGVLYLGRIPHGFYEDQMKAYFSQFGDITRLRLSRNKKTGRSKHYAFLEFSSSAVAAIVAETMDNYLLMGHILRCKVIPPEEVHSELWVGAGRKFRRVPQERVERVRQNKERTEEEREKAERRLLKRQDEKKRKLKDAGIEYDLDPVAYNKKTKPT
ncbi:RNA-binding domain-containing protein [Rickenella mellea]|uniref:RNA-binding domain-containing protein n=1 Tax=Rickenella mellea TaxID=50990 RepID=A0A4Y7Q7Y6_9AGAM|nr:RNA-binding domain-containing protein [Rickenella mellea]